MTDPIQGSAMAFQNLQKIGQSGLDQADKAADASKQPETSFKDVMQQTQAPEETNAAQQVEAVDSGDKIDPAKKLDDLIKGVFDDQDRIEQMMGRCMDGADLSQTDLLKLQSTIYAYAQKVDLASKVVDKATGGLKQVMNTQV